MINFDYRLIKDAAGMILLLKDGIIGTKTVISLNNIAVIIDNTFKKTKNTMRHIQQLTLFDDSLHFIYFIYRWIGIGIST